MASRALACLNTPVMTPDTAAPMRPEGGISRLLFDLRHRRRRFRQLGGWMFVFAVSAMGAPTIPALYWFGVFVACLGMLMRLWASGFVRKNQVLATNGPYALVRHPLYTGNILICAGFAAASGQWWALVAGSLFVALFYPSAVAYEDRKLHRLFPEDWEPWAGRTPAIIPGLARNPTASSESWTWSLRQSLFENGEPIYVAVMLGWLYWLWRLLGAGA